MHQPLTMPNQRNCICEVVDTQWLQISHKCEDNSTVFHRTCAHFGIIWHLGLKNLTASPWASSIHNNNSTNNNNKNNNNNDNNNKTTTTIIIIIIIIINEWINKRYLKNINLLCEEVLGTSFGDKEFITYANNKMSLLVWK